MRLISIYILQRLSLIISLQESRRSAQSEFRLWGLGMEETISLKEIFETLKKRIWMIVVITALTTALSGVVSYFILTPVYQASTQILLQSESEDPVFDINQVRTNLELVNTYSVIIKSSRVLEEVIQQLELDTTVEQLQERLEVTSEENSQVINVTVESTDPAEAVRIANTVANVFQKEIVQLMNIDNVNILSRAELKPDPVPVKPNPLLNMAIAFVVGLMIGIGLAFLLEYLDNTIKTEEDIENILDLPILGVVTEIEGSREQAAPKKQTLRQRMGSESIGS